MSEGNTRWRKKPVVVEARQWDGTAESATGVIDWVLASDAVARYIDTAIEPNITVDTLEGRMHAMPGDWIIRGVKGEFYPCKPDIFEATYEPADEAGSAG